MPVTDRADEIAQEIAVDACALTELEGTMTEQMMADAIAAALRSYGNERLEKAAVLCGTPEERDEEFMRRRGEEEAWADERDVGRADAARLVRSLKSQPEQPT